MKKILLALTLALASVLPAVAENWVRVSSDEFGIYYLDKESLLYDGELIKYKSGFFNNRSKENTVKTVEASCTKDMPYKMVVDSKETTGDNSLPGYLVRNMACETKIPDWKPAVAYAPINWGPYMKELEKKIKSGWNPPKDDVSKRISVFLRIAPDGNLLETKINKSSDSELANKSALAAVEAAKPFAPLPKEFKGKSIDIDFTFDYNVIDGAIINNATKNVNLKTPSEVSANVDWNLYLREIERTIRRNWIPPKNNRDVSAVTSVGFKILSDGTVKNVRIIKSSGSPLVDQVAKATIESSSPLSPLPKEFKGDSIDVDFTFECNAFGHNIHERPKKLNGH